MGEIGFVIMGLFFVVFHRFAARHTVEFWRSMGRKYNEKFIRIGFVIVGSWFIIASLLSMLGYLKTQGAH